MSRVLNKQIINKIELQVLIVRNYQNQKDFCKSQDPPINYGSFRTFMAGNDSLTKLNKRLSEIMTSHNYDPYFPQRRVEEPRLQAGANRT